jgi:hypothetical protein
MLQVILVKQLPLLTVLIEAHKHDENLESIREAYWHDRWAFCHIAASCLPDHLPHSCQPKS